MYQSVWQYAEHKWVEFQFFLSNAIEFFSKRYDWTSKYFEFSRKQEFIIFIHSLWILRIKQYLVWFFFSNLNSVTRSIYTETNQLEEKLSVIILFVIIEMTCVCIFVPWTIHVFFIYFATDLGADAFELPCSMW